MRTFKLALGLLTTSALLLAAGCTSVAVNPAAVADVKTVTITRLALPEYSYLGRDMEAGAKRIGVVGSYYALGVFGLAVGDAMRVKSEQPYRDAIRTALLSNPPTFESALNSNLERKLQERGIKVLWIEAPAKLADNSGYDMSGVDIDTEYLVEIFPFSAGFSYENNASSPHLDIRWRLMKRYANGKLIETNRGTVFYDVASNIGNLSSVQIPKSPEYTFPGPVTELGKHGEKPAAALRTLAEQIAVHTSERALPASPKK